jgi:Flp pilus assembly protein CpaB
MVIVVSSLAVGLFSGFQLGQEAGERKAHEEIDRNMTTVFVAAEELRQCEDIRRPELVFVRRRVPKDAVPPNAIGDIEQLQSVEMRRALRKGEVCRNDDVVRNGRVLPPGCIAMTISARLSHAGLFKSGSPIDVLAILPKKNKEPGHVIKVILQNSIVLAVNNDDIPVDGVQSPLAVTIAVTRSAAEKLRLIQAEEGASILLVPARRRPDGVPARKTGPPGRPKDRPGGR